MRKIVVFSGVNFTEGGPLSVMKDAIAHFMQQYSGKEYNILLLVHKRQLFEEYFDIDNIQIEEFPWAKENYFKRLYFEWAFSKKLSKQIKPYLWFALHDITPNVIAQKQVVYCHNPSPFFSISLRQAIMDYKFLLHRALYGFFYKINIKKNNFVIVQQQWLKQEFQRRYKINNVIVSHPSIKMPFPFEDNASNSKGIFTFFYPAFPRVFKNFEVLLAAVEHLNKSINNFQIVLTINGSENRYAAYLKKKYGHFDQIKFLGQQPREQVLLMIKNSNCIVFPSKLETWGLPLTEAAYFNKTILAADLPYAHETLQGYEKVIFFQPDHALELSKIMLGSISGNLLFTKPANEPTMSTYLNGWGSLFAHILVE